MKLIDKLKNALFEEEYVEVEEKKPTKKEAKKEKPVAKKIELPKREEKPVIENTVPPKPKEDEPISDRELLNPEKDFRFPLDFDEDDFVEQPIMEEKPVIEEAPIYSKREEKPVYREPERVIEKREPVKPYNTPDYSFKETNGLYEKKAERKEFTPSPVISPVYGILDKNYRKDDIVSRREIKRSSYASNHLDLDAVRDKAYGDLTSDMGLSMSEAEKMQYEDEKIFEEAQKPATDNLLVDMQEEDTTPAVTTVTVGDAEEYFNDLGLEYNVDYKDVSQERVTGRRTSLHNHEEEQEVEEQEKEPVIESVKEEGNTEENDGNLFDLIDSMYEEKEKKVEE